MSRRAASQQPALDLTVDVALCRYGMHDAWSERKCHAPATHRACWHKAGVFYLSDGRTEVYDAGHRNNGRVATEGGIECCLDHANYYANAWAYQHQLYPHIGGETWIDILEAT